MGQTNEAASQVTGGAGGIDLSAINMDALIRVIRPSRLQDGAHQLMLPVYNTQVSVKAYPGSARLSDEQLDEALVAVRDLAISFEMNLSRTRADSQVTMLNDAQGAPVALEARTLDLIDREYGSMSLYLRNQLMMSPADIRLLRKRYLTSKKAR